MTPVRRELLAISRLAGPAVATQVGGMLMGVVDILMVSRISVEALGAAAIGNVWTSLTLFCSTGIILGIDPIVSQAHGARDGERLALVLQRGVLIALALSLPVAALFGLTEAGLTALRQDPELARAAHDYVIVQLPSVPAVLVFIALRQYLQGRTIVRQTMWLMLIANAVLPTPILEVRYENLVANKDRVTQELLAYCGLDWNDACLAFHDADRSVRTASEWQVRQPIYQTSVERWRRYETHLGPLKKALGDAN